MQNHLSLNEQNPGTQSCSNAKFVVCKSSFAIQPVLWELHGVRQKISHTLDLPQKAALLFVGGGLFCVCPRTLMGILLSGRQTDSCSYLGPVGFSAVPAAGPGSAQGAAGATKPSPVGTDSGTAVSRTRTQNSTAAASLGRGHKAQDSANPRGSLSRGCAKYVAIDFCL